MPYHLCILYQAVRHEITVADPEKSITFGSSASSGLWHSHDFWSSVCSYGYVFPSLPYSRHNGWNKTTCFQNDMGCCGLGHSWSFGNFCHFWSDYKWERFWRSKPHKICNGLFHAGFTGVFIFQITFSKLVLWQIFVIKHNVINIRKWQMWWVF